MLLIQGVFRSGTTSIFRALRQDDHLTCYYEPLHPNLLNHVQEADARNPSHRKSSLFAEYTSLAESVKDQFYSDLGTEHAVLDAEDHVPSLRTYLQHLTTSASEVMLQFNRAFWMAPWLERHLSDSTFVHVVRDPRSVIWSQFTTQNARVRMDWPVIGRDYLPLSSGNLKRVFSPYAYHGAYQVAEYYKLGNRALPSKEGHARAWAYDRLKSTRDAPPYVQALALWGAQTYVCHVQAQTAFDEQYRLLRYEDLCTAPVETLRGLYDHHGSPLPASVRTFGVEQIHARRLASWRNVEGAEEHFQSGIRQAGIADLMEEMNYDVVQP